MSQSANVSMCYHANGNFEHFHHHSSTTMVTFDWQGMISY